MAVIQSGPFFQSPVQTCCANTARGARPAPFGAAAATPAAAAWTCPAAAPALPLMGSEAAGRLRSVPAGAAISRHSRKSART